MPSAAYKNEDSVGVALAESGVSREDVYVTTKYISGDIKAALEASLKNVRLPRAAGRCV